MVNCSLIQLLGILNSTFMAFLVIFAAQQISKLKKQIAGSTKDVETTRLISFTDQVFKLHEIIIDHPEIMEVFEGFSGFKFFDFKKLDSVKAQRIWYILMRLTFYEQMFEQHKEQIVDRTTFNLWFNFLINAVNECPEWKEVYTNTKEYWDKDFTKELDAGIRAITKSKE